jgi:hypothetical protein
MLARLHEFVEAGIEAEPEFVKAVKEADPEISNEELKKLIRLFRDAVYDRQQRDSAISLNLFSDSRSSDGLIFSAPESITSPKASSSASMGVFFLADGAAPRSL